MERYERIITIHRILKTARCPVSMQRLMDETGASRATAYRDIGYLRDFLFAPVVTDHGGHVSYDAREAERFELPGLWLTADELYALLTVHQLLTRTGRGVLASALAPLKARIDAMLSQQVGGKRLPIERVRVIAAGARRMNDAIFSLVATAVLERRQLGFSYRARSNDVMSQRTVSPQRLIHYRENWYLDAFDPDRDALRSFAVDRISNARVLDAPARDLADDELDQHLGSSYGIFAGIPKAWATIRFSANAARWVADMHWHAKQEGRFLDNGSYELRLPYSNARELLMDVLRYGADAEIVAPPALRAQARSMLQLALAAYVD